MAKNCNLCRNFTGYYTKAYCGYYQEKFWRIYYRMKFTNLNENFNASECFGNRLKTLRNEKGLSQKRYKRST